MLKLKYGVIDSPIAGCVYFFVIACLVIIVFNIIYDYSESNKWINSIYKDLHFDRACTVLPSFQELKIDIQESGGENALFEYQCTLFVFISALLFLWIILSMFFMKRYTETILNWFLTKSITLDDKKREKHIITGINYSFGTNIIIIAIMILFLMNHDLNENRNTILFSSFLENSFGLITFAFAYSFIGGSVIFLISTAVLLISTKRRRNE